MSCSHGWHGCGPWVAPPYGTGWYGPDWYEDADWPDPRRPRRYRRRERGSAEELEARLDELRQEIGRLETELASVQGPQEDR